MKVSLLRRGLGQSCAVSIPADSVAEFARRWPCFGEPARLFAEFDTRGELVDLSGDDSMNGEGVAALLDDVRQLLFAGESV